MTQPVARGARHGRARTGGLRRLRGLLRCEGGLSAVEFALFAPILFFGLLATVDLGLALYQRMTIDHVLRAGAQSAMADPPGREGDVERLMETIAERNFPAGENGEHGLALDAVRYFACPGDTGIDESLTGTSPCDGGKHTLLFYHLSATKTYKGLFRLEFDIGSTMQVQIR